MHKLKPLAIKEFGMVSSLGVGAELNASAMRCGYDGLPSFTVSGRMGVSTAV